MAPSFELHPALAVTALLLVLLVAHYLVDQYGARRHYPPGPRGLPILGNLLQLSRDAWVPFRRMKEKYGPIVYLNVFGHNIVVLNTLKASADLLDRQSAVYSDRPTVPTADTLTGSMFFPTMKHGERWSKMRRIAQECLSKGASRMVYPHQLKEALLMTDALLKSPRNWDAQLRRASASIIASATYGLASLESEDDPEVTRVNEFADTFLAWIAPSKFVSEFLIKYLPTSMSKAKKGAQYWFEEYTSRFTCLYKDSVTRMSQGGSKTNLTNVVCNRKDRFGLNDTESAWLLAAMFAAGSETTSSVLMWFIFMMVTYPDIQAKAQEELDSVIGRSRLPSFADLDQLHYVRAIVRETLRWGPVIPLGVPHRATEDNWYQGYYIPKGTICVANVWSINRDPELYGKDAEMFNPSRHLDEHGHLNPALVDTKDESHATYGFGKRICVGRHVANNSLFISIATILWALKINPPKDVNGCDILPSADNIVNTGLIMRPVFFDCNFEPRFPDAEAVIANAKELVV